MTHTSNMKSTALAIIIAGLIGCLLCILGSCGTTTYMVAETSPIDDVIEYNLLYQMARYDSSAVIKLKFPQAKTTIIYMQDSSSVVIEGKRCDYRKNEMLYYIAERWYNPGFPGSRCEYFLTNEEQTIRYHLLDQE